MSDQPGQFMPPPPPPGQYPQGQYPQGQQPGLPPGAAGYGVPAYPASGVPAYPASSGRLGKPRGIGACIGLAIITLGIYTYVWTWKTHDEIKQHSGIGVGGALGFVIYFVVSPVTYFLLPSEVGQMLGRSGRASRVSGITGLWLLLPLIGTIVWFVKVQGQLNEYWRSLGAAG